MCLLSRTASYSDIDELTTYPAQTVDHVFSAVEFIMFPRCNQDIIALLLSFPYFGAGSALKGEDRRRKVLAKDG